MENRLTKLRLLTKQYWSTFSYVGLVVATLFFAASLTPTLLPRQFAVQGILSGIAAAVGYGVGKFLVWLWHYLEIPDFSPSVQLVGKRATTVCVALVAGLFLWWATVWQNSIRQLMEMPPVESAYPLSVAAIAAIASAVTIAFIRLLLRLGLYIHSRVSRVVPRRVSIALSTLAIIIAMFLVTNHVVARLALYAADTAFMRLDQVIDYGIEQSTNPNATGSAESLITWNSIGRFGKAFIATGPTQKDISEFWGKPAQRPLRVYVGLNSRETPQERAKLALEELKRTGGFNRKVLIVATPTGTGWLDPGAVDTVEYLHAGDTAIVTMQYSYLPSWITILVDPRRSRDSARALFNEIYNYWTTLPQDNRPKFYLHGLSLGALGSAGSADVFTVFEDPIQGGLFSGPPFPSAEWARATRYRNPDTPMWLPRWRDGSMLRFTGRLNSLNDGYKRWGKMRFVYIQHASDPMIFFSPDLLFRKPEWLLGQRGPDVSPYLRWYPIVTFLQTAFDLPMATTVPTGYGHNYAPSSYINSWIEVTQPAGWNAADTTRLKQRFPDR